MSHVTNIILTCCPGDAGIDNVNLYMKSINKGDLMNVKEYAGGGKVVEADVYVGAYDHIDILKFIEAALIAGWGEPRCLSLFMMDEHDDKFEEVLVKREEGPSR